MNSKFFILGIRYNPQLGDYLSKFIIADKKENKASISAKFEDYGEKTSMLFYNNFDNEGKHQAKTSTNCVYGSYYYFGYHAKDDAINALKKWLDVPGSSASRAKDAIAKLEAMSQDASGAIQNI